MNVNRRELIKLGGCVLGALGVASLPAVRAMAGNKEPDVDVYAFHCGLLKTKTQFILKDTRVDVPFDIPVPFFLIRHGSSWIAYDSGNNAAVAADPVKYWGKAVTDAYFPVMAPHEEFKNQIKKLGLKPADLHAMVFSHGHLDHCGAMDNLAGTKIPVYLQKAEIDEIKKQVASGKKSAYIPDDFNKLAEINVQPLDGVFDIFGDSTVIVFPTPGHTPGHQSLLVRTNAGQNLILAQDACYTLENMMANIPPGLAFDIPDAMVNIHHFKTMSAVGVQIVPPHDPDFWKGKPLAPQKFVL